MKRFIEGLNILAKYYPHGLDESYFMEAEHDIIYFHVGEEHGISEDSEDGVKLTELRFSYDDDLTVWTYRT